VTRILFVDDEPRILEALRDLLRKQRRRWDMVFVGSGEQALAELAASPFHVIVSDMRMRGMDGVALLQAVQAAYPHIARIVLSGHAERDAVERVRPFADDYLSKPCDEHTLRTTLERACARHAAPTADHPGADAPAEEVR
jgi:DNA-binding NtrC family response regulator